MLGIVEKAANTLHDGGEKVLLGVIVVCHVDDDKSQQALSYLSL
jgi:hypothetical protein